MNKKDEKEYKREMARAYYQVNKDKISQKRKEARQALKEKDGINPQMEEIKTKLKDIADHMQTLKDAVLKYKAELEQLKVRVNSFSKGCFYSVKEWVKRFF